MRCAALFATLLCLGASISATAEGVLIPVPDRRDHVPDSSRGILYITTSRGVVERFDVNQQILLSPIDAGDSLNGADLDPGASYLYAAEELADASQGFIRKVDLDTGAVSTLTYTLDPLELGAWDLKIGGNGKGLVSTRFQGAGFVPLRELDTATDLLSVRTDALGSGANGKVRQEVLISRGADGRLLYLTEPVTVLGRSFTYSAVTDSFVNSLDSNVALSNALSAVNRDGSLIALEFGGEIVVFDDELDTEEVLSGADSGVVFDSAQDILYAGDSLNDEIVAFNSNSWEELFRLPIGEDLAPSTAFDEGVMSMDAGRLFLSTALGVRMFEIAPVLTLAAEGPCLTSCPSPTIVYKLKGNNPGTEDASLTVDLVSPAIRNVLTTTVAPGLFEIVQKFSAPPNTPPLDRCPITLEFQAVLTTPMETIMATFEVEGIVIQ